MNDYIDSQGFRANVGIVLMRDGGELFLGGRRDGRGWQFPQGGINFGETPEQAMLVHTTNARTEGNKVILDGEFKLENGIRVLETDGVVLENMTARNYLSNGFFFTGSDYYRGSYLTAYRNGEYGRYAFDAYHGQWDNSLGWGSPDAGIYIGE